MKKLFPLLLCYVLTTTQCFAISGGPVFGGGRSINVVGAYSGVIQGISETDAGSGPPIPGEPVDPNNPTGSTPSNALGLFDLTVPGVSTATGAFILFTSGRVFGGTISASVDPDTAKLSGVLNGSYTFGLTSFNSTGTATTSQVTASAVGEINANIRATGTSSYTTARLTGTASLEVNFGNVDPNTLAPIIVQTILFNVSGFQQTNVAQAASTISNLTSLTGTGSGTGTGSSGS